MAKMLIHLIVAARPNFMKAAPLYHAIHSEDWCSIKLIHTGQHYDINMSDVFFQELGLPAPDLHLGVGSGSHAQQTGQTMFKYEEVCESERPDLLIVVGDVNATAACTLVAAKAGIPVAHLEAGLRSFDRSMPEEINRLVTDVLSNVLWTPSPDADENLRNEGIPQSKIERVGNIMIDSFEMLRQRIEATEAWKRYKLSPKSYGVVTLHRPANVDDSDSLSKLVNLLRGGAEVLPLVFPVHPRTRARLESFNLLNQLSTNTQLTLTEPLPYIEFMSLVTQAKLVLTDSGGIQEETSYLGVPCLTLRENTERPITISSGTNRLVSFEEALSAIELASNGKWSSGSPIELWDGKTAMRVVNSIRNRFAR